ncbi:Gfo/Idh/MocA family oxidoreductase [Luedemannella helvata]
MRAVVCGTRFGQVYLEAFRHPDNPVQLAGILSGGSDRSRACARHYDVPHYTSPDDIPDDVDIACVVIRGGLLGGQGADLALRLMVRGLHVLQEHPLHQDELAACLRQARRSGVVYHLNSFYVHVEPVRRFLAAVAELTRSQPIRYIDAACGFQLAYSLLDVLGQALGGVRPWAFADLPDAAQAYRATQLDVPFRSLDGVLGGVPVTLRVQNQMDPGDPDNYAHLMHRVTVGTEAGNLTLVSTHGPTVWAARPDFPRTVGETDAAPHFDAPASSGEEHLDLPSARVLGPAEAPGFRHVFGSVWSAGVARALGELVAAIEAGGGAAGRGQYHLTLCELWQDITARLGPPELLRADPPRFVLGDGLAAMARAAE